MAKESIVGREFDKPLIFYDSIAKEPQKYIAEKPYELTKFEYSSLRRKFNTNLLSNTAFVATIGFILAVVGKAISALLNKKSPTLEIWEIWAIVIGLIAFVMLEVKKRYFKTVEEEEFEEINQNIVDHFAMHRKRRVHITEEKRGDQ